MAFPSAISSGVLRSPMGRISMPEVRGTQDYFGLNYYSSDTVWFDLRTPKELFTHSGYPRDADLSEHGAIANIPQGLYDSIHWAVRTYPDLPIIITENGVEFVRRRDPPALHRAAPAPDLARRELQLAGEGLFPLDAGRQLRMGALWSQRFGLWALDIATQKRTKRPSADLYAAICKTNSLSADMVREYCPEVYDKIFPPFDG